MDTKYYFISGFILLIFFMYFYFKKPEIKNVHNIELEDVKKLLNKQEDSNKLVKALIIQLSKYIKSNSNKKLRLDVLNKSDLFKKDYRTSRILVSKSYNDDIVSTKYDFVFDLKQTFRNVIGFKYISSIMNLQLWHPEISASFTSTSYSDISSSGGMDTISASSIKTLKSGSNTAHFPNYYYYIDLIVEDVPYVACKKTNTQKHIIERIPIEFKSSIDLNHHIPINQENIYFYPISLDNLDIKLTNITDLDLSVEDIWAISDISLEFEITYIINETNCGLSTAK